MEGLIAALGIDIKLIIAQIVNFGILVFVLHRFAFKPLLKVIDERVELNKKSEVAQSNIEVQLKEIESLKKKAENDAVELSKKLTLETENKISALNFRLEKEVQESVSLLKQNEIKKLEEEKRSFFASLKQDVAQIVSLAVEKAVGEHATGDLKASMSKTALKHVEELAKKYE